MAGDRDIPARDRAAQLIDALRLQPHPEGGYFREIHRAAATVRPGDGRSDRSALTVIYFLLRAGDVSRWHRVASDETWHFHEGAPLDLLVATPDLAHVVVHRVGAYDGAAEPVGVVPAAHWQAATSTGAYTLVSCTVGPGFEFEDFELLRDVPAEVARLRQARPDLASFV